MKHEWSPGITEDWPQRVSGWTWFNRSALWMAVWCFHLGINRHDNFLIYFSAFVIIVNPFTHWLRPERAALRKAKADGSEAKTMLGWIVVWNIDGVWRWRVERDWLLCASLADGQAQAEACWQARLAGVLEEQR